MHSKDLERLIDSFERSTLLELKYTQGNTKVHLGRRQQTPVSTIETPLKPAAAPVAPTPATPMDEHLIAAPMAGIVYLRPSPTKPDFTSVGSQVSEGDTLAVIEAMKLFNPLEAEFACEIVEILVADGEDVERGTPIYRARKVNHV
ncbi:acetyl-CoA carboxylase biotin carboxyl carrier protein [Pseudomonas helleri]|uniref:Biotin carboxyl carrier protein of acetyl-CoA carboxylase n=1 Tax=Pseudomonas helleri TaxID=1608996 RepID=A0A7X1W518_9PSED|nr:biotin/lipoyl-containing protein [Pseudomonas helleri]MQT45384.1 acetyl-CoA carboxylase biotin carboxyl carrier protein [Pseudomonas helleri]MQT91432.1 acetyl-CoA carboxylase biotin carboxyl carrier protein [Pseudomonas helleri]